LVDCHKKYFSQEAAKGSFPWRDSTPKKCILVHDFDSSVVAGRCQGVSGIYYERLSTSPRGVAGKTGEFVNCTPDYQSGNSETVWILSYERIEGESRISKQVRTVRAGGAGFIRTSIMYRAQFDPASTNKPPVDGWVNSGGIQNPLLYVVYLPTHFLEE
jgi:hypothetical protein